MADILGALRRVADEYLNEQLPTGRELEQAQADASILRGLAELLDQAGTTVTGHTMVLVVRRDDKRIVATLEPDTWRDVTIRERRDD